MCGSDLVQVMALRWRHNGAITSQITSLTIVYSIVYTDADQRKHQSSASLAFVRRIYRGPVNSPHKWPVTRKMFPFDDVIMACRLIGDKENLKQYRIFVICTVMNKMHFYFKQNTMVFEEQTNFEISTARCQPPCSGFNFKLRLR